jgi:hypothetical protein
MTARSSSPAACLLLLLALGCAPVEVEVVEPMTIPSHEERTASEWVADLHTADREKRDRAVAALRAIGPAAIPVVEPELANSDPAVRYSALTVLAGYKEFALPSIHLVAERLSDPDPSVRAEAAYVISLVGLPAAHTVPALTTALDDTDGYVRWRAAMALGLMEYHGWPAIDSLRHHSHRDREIRVRTESEKSAAKIWWAWWRHSRDSNNTSPKQ